MMRYASGERGDRLRASNDDGRRQGRRKKGNKLLFPESMFASTHPGRGFQDGDEEGEDE